MSDGLTIERVDQLTRRYPAVFFASPAKRALTFAGWFLFLALTLFSLFWLGFFDLEMIARGLGNLEKVLSFMLPPAAHGYTGEFVLAILETLGMAFMGTLMASLAAVVFGFLGAKNVIANPVIHFGLRRAFDVLRGVDSLIWALIFINAVGLGPFAGIMAIAVSDTGTLSKLFAEAIENVNTRPIEGVKASGGGPLSVMRYGIFPQVFPVLLSNAIYYFESNTRSATILGIVGAGGIGLQLSDRIRINNWDEASFIIILILITVFLIDRMSGALRHRIIGRRD